MKNIFKNSIERELIYIIVLCIIVMGSCLYFEIYFSFIYIANGTIAGISCRLISLLRKEKEKK